MLVLTIIVAALLFGVLGPWLMGRVDRFLDKGGFSREEEPLPGWNAPQHKKSA